jgi:hypothetical protein
MTQANSFHLHPLSKMTDFVRTLTRSEYRLSEQRQRANRCLQFMTHIRDKVTSNDVNASLLGKVVNQNQDRARTEFRNSDTQFEELSPKGWAPDPHFLLASRAVVGNTLDQSQDVRDCDEAAVDQSERHRPRACPQNVPITGDHERSRRQHTEDANDLIRNSR